MTDSLKQTALNDAHTGLGAKMVEFAGFSMPIVYSSIIDEHKAVRNSVGLFDVSHMGEFRLRGDRALELLQNVTINDVSALKLGQAQYSAMCYPDGGIIDDVLVYKFDDHYMMVVNAANAEKDFAWITDHMIGGVDFTNMSDDITLVAVQGPASRDLLQTLTPVDLSAIKYYRAVHGAVADREMIISRTGYTGELGFELYMDTSSSLHVWNTIMDAGQNYDIQPAGLGARDTLRLEKMMCLYGNDITKDTNPIEAGLGWITKLDKGDFIGRDVLAAVKEQGPKRRLRGFELTGKGVPRHGYTIVKNGNEIGKVTSGSFSPLLSKGIGIGYVQKEFTDIGAEIEISIRGKSISATIIKPPFV